MDPLSLLRTFTINNELDHVVESGSEIEFGNRYSFDKTALTTYKSSQGKGDFYDLQSVLFFIKNVDLPLKDYFTGTRNAGVAQIKQLDKKVRFGRMQMLNTRMMLWSWAIGLVLSFISTKFLHPAPALHSQPDLY